MRFDEPLIDGCGVAVAEIDFDFRYQRSIFVLYRWKARFYRAISFSFAVGEIDFSLSVGEVDFSFVVKEIDFIFCSKIGWF